LLTVPEKTIAYIPLIEEQGAPPLDIDVSAFLKPLNENHKRDWFKPYFYQCLPLSIANMQGLAFSSPFTFDVLWDGGDGPEAIVINIHDDFKVLNLHKPTHVTISSHFGSGIFTFNFPLMLKTPPNINLMTIAAPNYPLPGISPMSGVVETDNLSFSFTLNFKIDIPNALITVHKDYPIMGIIPIPRNYCDSFKLLNAYDILNEVDIEEERQIAYEQRISRFEQNKNKLKPDRRYYKGKDIRNNKFKNHQLPKGDT
jgi:hypothetical protein